LVIYAAADSKYHPITDGRSLKEVQEKYGLDRPLHEQYIIYVSKVLQGDLGYSIHYSKPVTQVIFERIPGTLLLVLTSQFLGLLGGIVLGTLCARRHRSKTDVTMSIAAIGLYSMPMFWFGIILMLVFSIWLKILPTSGMMTPGISTGMSITQVLDVLRHLVLPATALTVVWTLPQYMRLTRASVIDVMRKGFVTAARAKGLSERNVFYRHVLRNALLPTVTMASIQISLALAGAVLTEKVFAWPGLGSLMVFSILYRDYPLLIGNLFITSIVVMAASLVTDAIYALLDPRVTIG